MDGGFAVIRDDQRFDRCAPGLRLRQRLVKLRWLRLDAEADQLANEILDLECELPKPLSRRIPDTD
jgi:hypothetical protein